MFYFYRIDLEGKYTLSMQWKMTSYACISFSKDQLPNGDKGLKKHEFF